MSLNAGRHCIRTLNANAPPSLTLANCIRAVQKRYIETARKPSPSRNVPFRSKHAPKLKPTGRFAQLTETIPPYEEFTAVRGGPRQPQSSKPNSTLNFTNQADRPRPPPSQQSRQLGPANPRATSKPGFSAAFDEDANDSEEFEDEEDDDDLFDFKDRRNYGKLLPKINGDIPHDEISYIDPNGVYHENVPLKKVLNSFSRESHVLVLVNPATGTCRLFTIKEYNKHLERMIEQQRDGPANKELQITWNVGDNDLTYRLQRAIKHLQNGSRVSIILGARKSKLVRDRNARQAMLDKIRETLRPYGTEWREMTGGFPNAELWFQGSVKPKEDTGIMEDTTGKIPSTIIGGDSKYISREELQAGREKFKGKGSRRVLRQEADMAFRNSMDSSDMKASAQLYWEQLPVTKSGKTPTNESGTSKSVKEEYDNAASEFNQSDPAKLQKQQETQERLRSVASQFSKLGTGKSLFGGKLGGR